MNAGQATWHRILVFQLSFTWVLLLLWGELFAFVFAALRCTWPEVALKYGQETLHFAVIADPQLTDYYSYGRFPIVGVLSAIEFYCDTYMRKVFASIRLIQQPEHIWFVGDLNDGGRTYDSQETFDAHLRRFEGVFGNVKADQTKGHHYMPGNHDIGIHEYYNPVQAARYQRVFGPLSNRVQVCNTEFVTIDAVGLTLGDEEHQVAPEPASFHAPRSHHQGNLPLPPKDGHQVVLFSHIPLHRKNGTGCGPKRQSSEGIRDAHGKSYQNELPDEISKRVLKDLKPLVVFSGDDHDNCLVYHEENEESIQLKVPEYTVGSISWLQGVSQPSYALVSIAISCGTGNPVDTAHDIQVEICLPPSQRTIYLLYSLHFGWTFLSLAYSSRMVGRRKGDKHDNTSEILPATQTLPLTALRTATQPSKRVRNLESTIQIQTSAVYDNTVVTKSKNRRSVRATTVCCSSAYWLEVWKVARIGFFAYGCLLLLDHVLKEYNMNLPQ